MSEVVVLSPEKLCALIGAAVEVAVEAALKRAGVLQQQDEFITTAQVGERFNISRTALFRLRREGTIKSHNAGGKLLFSVKEIEGMIKKTKQV